MSTFNAKKWIEEKYRKENFARDYISKKYPKESITENKEKDERTWFKKSKAFDDGYNFGDIALTTGATIGDIAVGISNGAGSLVEGVVDLGMYGASGIASLFGNDDAADNIKKAALKDSFRSWTADANDFVSENSLLGDKSDMITEGLGYAAGILLTAGAAGAAAGAAGASSAAIGAASTAATTGLTGLSSMGSGMSEAYAGGATDGEAVTYGAMKGTIDAGTELIFGGLGKGVKALGLSRGIGGLDDIFAKAASSKLAGWISNPTVRTWISNGVEGTIKAGGEGVEEVLAGWGSSFAKKLTYLSDEELSDIIEDENLLDQFITGFVVGEISQSNSVIQASKSGQDFVSGLTVNESKVVDKVYNDAVSEAEQDGKKLTKKDKNKIYDDVQKQFERGEISTDTIEEVLGGDDYTAYKNAFDSEAKLKQEYEELGNKQNPTLAEQSRYAELKTQIDGMSEKSEADTLKGKMSDTVHGLIDADSKKLKNSRGSYLAESYNQKSQRGKAYEVDLSQVEEKYQGTYKKAAESGVLNNTRKTHEFVDMLAKLAADKGVSFDFTNNERLKSSGFAVDGKTVNGYIAADGSITLNTQSAKYLNSVVGHEISHILEGSELYSALQSAVSEYAKSKGEYDSRLADMTETYKGVENADPEAELIADLVGDYLFTDEAFVRSLLTQNRTLFERIFDEIKYLCRIVTAGSKEARQLEKVKKVFSDVYRDSGTAQQKNTTENGGVRYSLSRDDVRSWNIDWDSNNESSLKEQLRRHLVVVNTMEPVADVVYSKQSKKPYYQVLDELLKDNFGYKIQRKEYGTILFDSDAIEDTRNYVNNDAEAAAIIAAPYVLKRGKAISGHKNHKGKGNVTVTFAAPVVLNEKVGNVAVSVMYGKGRVHSLRVLTPEGKTFELLKTKDTESTITGRNQKATVEPYIDSVSVDSILNPDENVKQKDVFGFKINENSDVNEDLLEEVSYFHPDAEVDEQGNITVYHRTTKENADKIRETGVMTAKEDALFFSSKENGYASDYGDTVVKLKIPSTELRLNDVFDGEVHFDIPLEYKNGGYSLEVSKYLIESDDDSNDIGLVKNSLSNDGERVDAKYGDYAVSGEDIRLETQEDMGPVADNTESDSALPDDYAPIGENVVENDTETEEGDGEIDGIIKTVKDNLSQKRQNYVAERAKLTAKQQETLGNIDAKIAETQAEYDGKKNKDTRVANTLLRRIESLKTRRANIEADYAKRLNNLESRIQGIDELMQKDYTQVAETEKAINRIDKIFEFDKAALDEEFEEKRAKYANKNVYIGKRARALYQELVNLKKGVRASEQLGYLLDLGYDFKSLKAALAHIDMSPTELVNTSSDIEANVRLALDAEYDEKVAALDGEYREQLTQLETDAENQRKAARTANQRKTKMGELEAQVAELIGDTSTWVDKKMGLSYKVNTLRRNLRDIVRDQNGKRDTARADAIYDYLQGTYNKNEAELNRESNKIKEQFEKEKINSAESEYIMMLGELRENPETTLDEKEVGDFLEKHKDKIDTEKVERVIEQWRKTADELFERVNKVLKEAGMKEIPYRKGYYFHFTEEQGKVAKFFESVLNWKTQNNEIPTDIAGLTEQFNPQRKYQSFDKQRKGDSTVYDFLRSADQYINGTLDWIYHIEDIQKRRAFENYIRYVHSEEGIKNKIDALRNSDVYDADELQKEIELVLNEAGNPLNNFVTDFRTQTNTLAGKKSSMDRGMEELTNRKFYSTMTNLSNRVSANMVGGSVSSALTNFIPITQSWGQVSPIKSLKAMSDTVRSYFKDDGVVDKSDFLTNRLKSADSLYKTTWDKVGEKVGWLMEAVDNFTSQTVWRSKYNDNLSKGMSETAAIKDADQFAENVIAGRSRGNMPTVFDSKNPIIKTMTMFQLEVNNQYGYMFKDMPQDLKTETKGKLIKGYASMFIGAYAYNALFSALTGRDAAFDPIGIIEDLLRDMGLFGEDDEEEPADTILNFTDNVLEELPFISGFVGGGRIPISSAMPYGEGVYEAFEGAVNDIADGDLKSLFSELLNPVTYLLPPVGGGQIKKTVQGIGMYLPDEDHPIAGSYTADGALRYPVDDSALDIAQAAVFGRWANKNARDYIEGGHKALEEKQQQELIDSGMSIQDYWEYREGLSGLKTINEKADYIAGLDLPTDTKNLLLNNIANRDEEIDLDGYENFTDFEELDFAQNNPEKYEFLWSQGVTVGEYQAFDEDTKAAYSWAAQYPEKYQVSRAVTDNIVEYKSYSKALSGIESDKDKNGKSISGSRKKKVVEYINGLDLDYGQKIILLKSEYTSEDRYNRDIVEYLNDRDDISRSEMEAILKELGFTVLADGTVKW